MPSIGSTTQRRAAPTGYSRTGRCGWQESKKMEPQMHADARRWIRIRHGLHGGYRSRRSWQASLKRWSLSHPLSVHLRFQFLAFPPAAPGCRGGRSSPRTKPHAPIRHGAARAAPRSPRCTAATRPHAPIRAAVPSARASSVAAEPLAPEAVARPALPFVPPGAHMRRW
jgi:hypothetical protein